MDKNKRETMTNKSAFPVFDSSIAGQDYECIDAGMTLRDYFAAKAMQALIETNPRVDLGAIAENSYMMADVMMKVRGKQ